MGALGGIALLPGCDVGPEEGGTCRKTAREDTKLPPSNWFRGARVAGLSAYADATVCDVEEELDRLADERVTVVEVDSELSSYLDEAGFVEQLRVCDFIARECHARGMRCVVYYPVLEALTADADTKKSTMAKDHPDWIQVGMDGKQNMFVGGGGRVFWVAPGEESAWLCPTSGYVDYFNQRVERLAGTALDGLWGDVPLLSDIVGVWPCVNESCRAKFRADTGLETPIAADWNDPVFLRWVNWRHRLIWELEQRIVEHVKRKRPEFEVIIETVTMDYSGGTVQGLDGAYADDGRILRVWEIDAVSDATAMRGATENDWYSMAVMMKHARGCSEPRPAWTFSYGYEADDAERVMALCIATGCSPYETKIPQMNTSVGTEYRKRMYRWLEDHPQILASQSANEIAVLYSSVSRDWLDQARGVGLYTSNNPNDELWWSDQDDDSATDTDYVADYRGFCKLLMQSHAPFDVVTSPHADARTLGRYKLVVVPSAAGLAMATIDLLRGWVDGGGRLVITGREGGMVDEAAVSRGAPALLTTFGLDPTIAGWTDKRMGAGRILFTPERAGRVYFRGDTVSAIPPALDEMLPNALLVQAPPSVLFELRRADTGEVVIAVANLEGLGTQGFGVFTKTDAAISCAVGIPDGRSVARAILTKPGVPDEMLPFAIEQGRVRVSFVLSSAAAVIITLA